MRRVATCLVFTLAAACWIAAGPGALTLREILTCPHDAMPMERHPASPSGACFCAQMTAGFDVTVSPPLPASPAAPLAAAPAAAPPRPAAPPPPRSPSFAPAPPPPNGLA